MFLLNLEFYHRELKRGQIKSNRDLGTLLSDFIKKKNKFLVYISIKLLILLDNYLPNISILPFFIILITFLMRL